MHPQRIAGIITSQPSCFPEIRRRSLSLRARHVRSFRRRGSSGNVRLVRPRLQAGFNGFAQIIELLSDSPEGLAFFMPGRGS